MSCNGSAGLYIFPHGKTMNGKKYLELVKDKLKIHMDIHQSRSFMHGGAPCDRYRTVSDFLKNKEVEVWQWPGNSPDVDPKENL